MPIVSVLERCCSYFVFPKITSPTEFHSHHQQRSRVVLGLSVGLGLFLELRSSVHDIRDTKSKVDPMGIAGMRLRGAVGQTQYDSHDDMR